MSIKILEEMLEDVEDLISTHDRDAVNGEGVKVYERITLSGLKDRINLLKKLLEEK